MLTFRNVNDAFVYLTRAIHHGDPENLSRNLNTAFDCRRASSRYGPVIRCDYPQLICYTNPTERVLLNAARDFNPFFGIYESLWTLAGRNDVAPLVTYAKRMADFSDDGVTFNAAYGERWRRYSPDRASNCPEIDQLTLLVEHLATCPDTRRAVLSMWNVEDDLLRIGCRETTTEANKKWKTFDPPSKDVCCNLNVVFQLRREPRKVEPTRIIRRRKDGGETEIGHGTDTVYDDFVDIIVNNRSNDLVWGLAGNDYLCFSFLQEYVTARLNAELGKTGSMGNYQVGRYFHFTADLHAYTATFKPTEWLDWHDGLDGQYFENWYGNYRGVLVPLVSNAATFEEELPRFVTKYATIESSLEDHGKFTEPFFRQVACPMLDAFHTYRRKGAAVMSHVARIVPSDWRVAAFDWLNKRLIARRKSENVPTTPPVTIDEFQRDKEGGKTVLKYDSNVGGLSKKQEDTPRPPVNETVEQITIGVESNLRLGIDVPVPELTEITDKLVVPPKKPEPPAGTVENPHTHDPIADKLRNPELPLPANPSGFEVDLTKGEEIVPPASPHSSHTWKDDRPNTTCVKCGAYKHLGSGFLTCKVKESK